MSEVWSEEVEREMNRDTHEETVEQLKKWRRKNFEAMMAAAKAEDAIALDLVLKSRQNYFDQNEF